MDLVNETQRRLYGIDEEALTTQSLEEVLRRFGIAKTPQVQVNYSTLDSLSSPADGNIIVRVMQPGGQEKSVVCLVALIDTITSLVQMNGLQLDEMYRGLYTYKRPAT